MWTLAVENILLREDRSLVNRTVAYDFGAHKTQSSSVYRLPMCTVCGTGAAGRRGSIALPWADAR